MRQQTGGLHLTGRLIDSLYVEAMVLADEVRAYFDEAGRLERESLTPVLRVGFSCESLKVTTRLMHVIAWLLTRRAVESGELTPGQARAPARRLGKAADSDAETVKALPEAAQMLIEASRDLYARVVRLDMELDGLPDSAGAGPVRGLMDRLERAF